MQSEEKVIRWRSINWAHLWDSAPTKAGLGLEFRIDAVWVGERAEPSRVRRDGTPNGGSARMRPV